MERRLRLLDHVYRRNDRHRIEGKIISAEDTDEGELRYIVFFPGEESYFFYTASELVLCSNSVNTIFLSNYFQQHPFQPKELTDSEVTTILDTSIDNPNSRRILWYDILFYKFHILSVNQPKEGNCGRSIHPTLIRLLRYSIPDEIRCFVWSEFLGIRSCYEIGYYSIIRNKQYAIPSNSLSVIEADLRRMEITPQEYRQLLHLLTSIYLHDPKMGYVQGMHFLAYTLLCLFSEEEAFFIFLRIIHFLPENYYGNNLEGVNTDLLVVAAMLNKLDSFLYNNVETKTDSMLFFLTPIYKWLVDLFSHPFHITFTYQLLDILLCFGNWAFILAPLVMIMENRQDFIASSNLDDITRIFSFIPSSCKEGSHILELIYEMCLKTDIKEINELRSRLREENATSYSNEGDIDIRLDEQNGLVGDLYRSNTSDLCLSLQMSLHMQQISSSFMRVSGVEDHSTTEQEPCLKRSSFGIPNKGRLLNFNELSENDEEEVDCNPWRESVMDEDGNPENRILSTHLSKRSSLDSDTDSLSPCEEEDEPVSQPRMKLQFPIKWVPADVLFRKVLSLYDSIHNKTTYNVTNRVNDVATDGHFFFSEEIAIDNNYLGNYPVLSLSPC